MIISVRCVRCGWVDSTDAWEASDPPCCPMCSGDSAGELGGEIAQECAQVSRDQQWVERIVERYSMVESGDDYETDREELYRYDD